MNDQKYHQLEEIIILASYPDAIYDSNYGQWAVPNGDGGFFALPCNLENVFLVIEDVAKKPKIFMEITTKVLSEWKFLIPLRDQSDELLQFLYDLLLPSRN